MDVRPARADDLPDVMGVLDGAMLAVDIDRVRGHIAEESVLVATDDSRVLGVLVRSGDRIEAIAVRRARRGQGIGRTLVETAADAIDNGLVAEFDTRAKPFYESLGFAIECGDEPGRFRGYR